MPGPARLYDVDFYRWTREQAALLRRIPDERLNLPVDRNHVAEEIEDTGRSDLRAADSRIGVILEHLLKLEHSPTREPPRRMDRHGCSRSRRRIENSGRQPEACGASFRSVREGLKNSIAPYLKRFELRETNGLP